MDQVKPGYTTTEFWLHAIPTLAGLLLASGVVHPGTDAAGAVGALSNANLVAQLGGMLMSIVAPLVYIFNRTKVKTAALEAGSGQLTISAPAIPAAPKAPEAPIAPAGTPAK